MSEHTLGPWHAGHLGTDTFRREVILDPYYGQVAEIIDRGETGRGIACLIAAAPDLLAALQDIATLAVRDVHSGLGEQVLQAIESKARAAIAKAEGKP